MPRPSISLLRMLSHRIFVRRAFVQKRHNSKMPMQDSGKFGSGLWVPSRHRDSGQPVLWAFRPNRKHQPVVTHKDKLYVKKKKKPLEI